jgi:hypothetical protein
MHLLIALAGALHLETGRKLRGKRLRRGTGYHRGLLQLLEKLSFL